MIKLPVFIFLWALMVALKALTALSGLLAVAVLWRYRKTDYTDLPAWSRPWSNPEDWQGTIGHHASSLPKWWLMKNGVGFWSFYQYHAIRNSANGLRSFEWLDLDTDPKKVRYKTNLYMEPYEPRSMRRHYPMHPTVWYFAWQGFRAGFKVIHIWNTERHLVIKFGWRVEPSDAIDRELTELDHDTSFASKFLFWRKG